MDPNQPFVLDDPAPAPKHAVYFSPADVVVAPPLPFEDSEVVDEKHRSMLVAAAILVRTLAKHDLDWDDRVSGSMIAAAVRRDVLDGAEPIATLVRSSAADFAELVAQGYVETPGDATLVATAKMVCDLEKWAPSHTPGRLVRTKIVEWRNAAADGAVRTVLSSRRVKPKELARASTEERTRVEWAIGQVGEELPIGDPILERALLASSLAHRSLDGARLLLTGLGMHLNETLGRVGGSR
jgi:hypothetical protein